MRPITYILTLLIAVLMMACTGNSKTETADTTPVETETQPAKREIKKAHVPINPSDQRDYPEVVKDIGFPIHPNAEVANVGNALIEDGGLFMRLNIKDDIKNLPAFFDKGMADNGWTKENMKIYQGADQALRYVKEGVVSRIIMIDEDYYTKVAVNMTKQVDPAEFEDR